MRYHSLYVAIDDVAPSEAIQIVLSYLDNQDQRYIITPNPEMVMYAKYDFNFQQVLNHADLALVDGFGLKLALRILGIKIKKHIPGTDFLISLFKSVPANTAFFFLGAENSRARKAAQKTSNAYGINITGTAEPRRGTYNFKKEISIIDNEEHQRVIKIINQASPRILVVALGHGLQEKWIASYLIDCPSVKVAIGVGGALDFLSGEVSRAPQPLRMIGLEWLWRIIREPSRFKRIWTAVVVFSLEIIKWMLSKRFLYRPSVSACVLNGKNEVLIIERVDEPGHWQLPQGGQEKGESLTQAARRELEEEVSMKNLEIIGRSKKNIYRYSWKDRGYSQKNVSQSKQRYYGYRGQRATIVYARFWGSNNEINIDKEEVANYKWVSLDKLVESVHPIRRQFIGIVLEEIKKYV